MTVLPTVRDQIEKAAERRANVRAMRRFERFPLGRLMGIGAGALAMAAVLGFAFILLVLLGHRTQQTMSPAAGATPSHASARQLLQGDGIGSVKFGQSPAAVASRLERLYGPPVGARQFQPGYLPDVCGFYAETWNGLGAASDGRQFAAQLTAWFRHGRFVGYAFAANNFQTMFQNSWDQYARHKFRLSTTKGLAVGDSVAHGKRLYGGAFILTTEVQGTPPDPRLYRPPIWEVSTTSGQIDGGIGKTALVGDALGQHRIGIHSIGAGQSPNTPCR